MAYPLRAKEGLKFQVKQFVKKFYQAFDKEKETYVKSDIWMKGLTPRYLFDLTDGQQLELSRDQWQQALVSAFDEKKHWKDCVYTIKTNGKTGLEVRYYINVFREVDRGVIPALEKPVPDLTGNEPVDVDKIPF